jgi:hypothetical protein
MNEKKEMIRRIRTIDEAVRDYSAGYYNTRILFQARDNHIQRTVPFDIRDAMLLGAFTNMDVVIPANTGKGKTHLGRMVLSGLFGTDKYAELTVTPGLNENDFIDIDIEGMQSGRCKSKKEAIQNTPLLWQPGANLNELNRTPEKLQNIFIAYFERDFSIKGLKFPVGVPLDPSSDSEGKRHYQFRVISMNIGDQYVGTSRIDQAVKDRAGLVIPMDVFYPTKDDERNIVRNRDHCDLYVEKLNGGHLEDVLALARGLPIPVDIAAEEFIVYLNGFNNCAMSPTHSKEGIEFSQAAFCNKGCHASKCMSSDKGNICAAVRAPSGRAGIALKKIAKAVAALRAYKAIDAAARGEVDLGDQQGVGEYLDTLKVTLDDVIAVAPFVLTGKMELDKHWVKQHFAGNNFLATQHVIKTAYDTFSKWVASPAYEALANANGEITPDVSAKIKSYAETDPWAYNLKDLEESSYHVVRTCESKANFDALLK